MKVSGLLYLLFIFILVTTPEAVSQENSKILSSLKFVVLPEKEYQNDDYTLLVVSLINDKLSSRNIEYVESTILEKIRKKVTSIYEEKKGQGMTFSQLLASEAGGNVYVEISAKVEDKEMQQMQNSYPGVPSVRVRQLYARIVIGAYDVSTARGLGKAIISTNVLIAGNTSEKIEKVISKLSEDGFNEVLNKVVKYLEKGEMVSLRVIGIKKVSSEKEFSSLLDSLPSVKIKKRKSLSEGYIEYEVVVDPTVEEFINDLRDSLETTTSKFDITTSQNLVIVQF
ncbi:MAG: hypothetical protein N2712_04205 [Brevinematales bacterium]|nr:hypothetical protein [Brevinematales bacterium]